MIAGSTHGRLLSTTASADKGSVAVRTHGGDGAVGSDALRYRDGAGDGWIKLMGFHHQPESDKPTGTQPGSPHYHRRRCHMSNMSSTRRSDV